MRCSMLLGTLAFTVACATATDSPEDEGSGGTTIGATGGEPGTATGGVFGATGGLGGASTGGIAATGGGPSTGGATATGGAMMTGGTFGGDCEGYPAFASWTAAAGDFAVATCSSGVPCCEEEGCSPQGGDATVSGTHLFECVADHKPNCEDQNPGTTVWNPAPWTRVAECE